MHIPLSMALAHRELALLLINVSHNAAEPPKMLPAPLLHAGLRETLSGAGGTHRRIIEVSKKAHPKTQRTHSNMERDNEPTAKGGIH
jgi:hypothetical protein